MQGFQYNNQFSGSQFLLANSAQNYQSTQSNALYQNMKKIDRFIYDINNIIGHGSYSEVFIGQDTSTNLPVAIKVMTIQNLNDALVRDLVLNEITTMKSVKHKNIVQFYEVLQTQNNLYVILEYCNQGDLRQLLKQKKMLTEQEAIQILYEIVQGYQHLLKHSIIHRDIKPENILIHNGIFKIADFGFAIELAHKFSYFLFINQQQEMSK